MKQTKTPQQPAQTPATPSITLTKTAVPNSCKGNPIACDFTVTITNTGVQPATNQTVNFNDAITGDDATFGSAAITSPLPAGFSCPTTAQGLACTGVSIFGRGGYAHREYDDPDDGDARARHRLGQDDEELCHADWRHEAQCATAPLTALAAGAPPPLLKIVKVSTSNGVCDLTKNCPFRITITNVGAGALQGDLDIGDTVAATSTAGAAQSVPAGVENIADPNWTCTKPDVQTIACKNPKGLAPGASVTLDILVTPGPSQNKNDILENCAVFSGILAPGSSLCASVKLDPFSVKITKGGDQSCKPGGECHFTA